MIVMPATTTATAEPPPARAARLGRLAAPTVRATAIGVPMLIAAAVTLHLHTGGTDLTSWWIGDTALAAVLLVPGVLIASRRRRNVIGWLLLMASGTTAVAGAGREYLAYGFLGGTAPGYLQVGWVTDSVFLVSMGALPLILMFFPDGRMLSRRARLWAMVPLASMALGTFGALFFSDPDGVDVQGRRLYNPARHVFASWVADGAATLSWMLFIVSVVAAIVLLVLRYRRSDAEVRLQMRWVVWAGTVAVVELATELLPHNSISQVTGPIASALLTTSVCIAILRHRLFDIDLVISRTIVFALLSIVVAGIYIGVVTAFGAAVGTPTPIGRGLVATAVIALAFAPARSRLQHRVDRLVYGERRNPYRVMTELGERLHSEQDVGELTVVVQTLTRALKLPYAGVCDPSGEVLAESGRTGSDTVALALTYQGAVMGTLLVRPNDARGFDREVDALLNDLSRQIGAALHAVRLSSELQSSRHRLVSAKEEERRRLRRDLHDGLGPKLAALGLKIDTAHALVDSRPDASKAVLGGVKDDIRQTIDDIRRLVYGLRPPALDELGLVASLQECSARFEASAAPQITVNAAGPLPALPAAVEVAAYWIANEALTNVVRHAQATRCDIDLWFERGPRSTALHVLVRDDGTGLPPAWRPGVGTTSMRERAAELGGTVRIIPGPEARGTALHALIPCELTDV